MLLQRRPSAKSEIAEIAFVFFCRFLLVIVATHATVDLMTQETQTSFEGRLTLLTNQTAGNFFRLKIGICKTNDSLR